MAKYTLPDRSILLAMTGATAGKLGRIRGGCNALLNQRVARIIPHKINADFAWFLLSTLHYRDIFYNLGRGAAQPNISGEQIESVKIPCPPLGIQQRIANILNPYDTQIENNLRRIELLENAARLIYKEWFVKLNFPGREHTKIVDGLPVGWKVNRLVDIATLTMGQSPESKYYNSEGEGFPFHQGVTNFGSRYVHHESYSTFKGRIAQADDILCSVRAPVGRLNITMDTIVIGRGISAIRSQTGNQSFMYFYLRTIFLKKI